MQVQKQSQQKTAFQDLEERTYAFAKRIRDFLHKLPPTVPNREYTRQLVRSSGSVAANYIEADESLGQKDYLMKLKTCRKEAKESRLWLRLLDLQNSEALEKDCTALINEAKELLLIFSSMIRNRM